MSQKIAKHRANDASNDVHRPPLDDHGEKEDMAMMRMPLTRLHDDDGDVDGQGDEKRRRTW